MECVDISSNTTENSKPFDSMLDWKKKKRVHSSHLSFCMTSRWELPFFLPSPSLCKAVFPFYQCCTVHSHQPQLYENKTNRSPLEGFLVPGETVWFLLSAGAMLPNMNIQYCTVMSIYIDDNISYIPCEFLICVLFYLCFFMFRTQHKYVLERCCFLKMRQFLVA